MAEIQLSNVVRKFDGNRPTRPGEREQLEETERTAPGRIAALSGVNLTVPDGKTCVVIGPSGCGKSTLLRVVAGLDTDYTGTVYYDGRDMRDVPPRDRYIGMVFQNYALYPHFHGHSNLKFTFWMRKAPDAEAEARIQETSRMMGFGFSQLLGRKPGTLSGGQQQRLAIARALVRDPDLFLLDEPLSNLDAKLRMQTRVEIKRLLRQFAITAIYVTHDQEEAVALGDEIAIMRGGQVVQVGSYGVLRGAPVDTFVAGFFGQYPMNLVAGEVVPGGALAVGDGVVALPPQLVDRLELGRAVTVGWRPEGLGLAQTGQAGRINGEIESVEQDFARRLQFVRVRTQAGLLTVADGSGEPLALTQRVGVTADPAQMHLFDATTGARIEAG